MGTLYESGGIGMSGARITASFVSLGCFKNIVDTEVVGGILEKKGIEIVSSYEQSDWIIINTCGFIRDAKEESIEEMFNAMEKKEKGEVKHIAVFGWIFAYTGFNFDIKNDDVGHIAQHKRMTLRPLVACVGKISTAVFSPAHSCF